MCTITYTNDTVFVYKQPGVFDFFFIYTRLTRIICILMIPISGTSSGVVALTVAVYGSCMPMARY